MLKCPLGLHIQPSLLNVRVQRDQVWLFIKFLEANLPLSLTQIF